MLILHIPNSTYCGPNAVGVAASNSSRPGSPAESILIHVAVLSEKMRYIRRSRSRLIAASSAPAARGFGHESIVARNILATTCPTLGRCASPSEYPIIGSSRSGSPAARRRTWPIDRARAGRLISDWRRRAFSHSARRRISFSRAGNLSSSFLLIFPPP